MTNKKVTMTKKEASAIEAVKVAIRSLPRSLYFTADEDFGIEFWKRTGPGEAYGVSKPLKCRRAIAL